LRIAQSGQNINLAASLLSQGKLVAIPTETVYGLAANALDEKAVLAIFEAKQRPFFDPLIVHIDSFASVGKFAFWEDERLKLLAQKFWPGPLTILLPKKDIVPGIVTSGLPRVALRVPNHQLTLELLRRIPFPLAAPSANPFGYISPTEAQHVNEQLGKKVDYILDGGACIVGLESTIVGVEDGNVCIYRLGGLSVEEIENSAGKVDVKVNASGDPRAPGQLKSHYAPAKKLMLGNIAQLAEEHKDKKLAVISFGEEKVKGENIISLNLSVKRSLPEAAINLFKFLRIADESDADLVIAEVLPEKGLGRAINDRLRRAAA
jgi:L-threonylcarbamoyladenylate synthase